MGGAAFGLVDLDRQHPRERCQDCGAPLLYDGDALPVLDAFEPDTRAMLLHVWGHGGGIYGCPRCGLAGAFTIWMR